MPEPNTLLLQGTSTIPTSLSQGRAAPGPNHRTELIAAQLNGGQRALTGDK